MGLILLILLILLLCGAIPTGGYGVGVYPVGGILGVVLIVVLILLLMGRI